MGKPIQRVYAKLTYSRQFPETKDTAVQLLKELERELGIKDLSEMREPNKILHKIVCETHQTKYDPNTMFFNCF